MTVGDPERGSQSLVGGRLMAEGGEPNRVLDMRRDFQRMMKQRYSEMIEQLTRRKVLAFLSQAHIEPDLTIEMFLMDGPVPGFGTLELVDPAASEPTSEDSYQSRARRHPPTALYGVGTRPSSVVAAAGDID